MLLKAPEIGPSRNVYWYEYNPAYVHETGQLNQVSARARRLTTLGVIIHWGQGR
jgi:hypothetical protein